jgi:predicted Fe-S protein YdhL (DUF1289 family)
MTEYKESAEFKAAQAWAQMTLAERTQVMQRVNDKYKKRIKRYFRECIKIVIGDLQLA